MLSNTSESVELTREWLENLDEDTLDRNNYFTKSICLWCQDYKEIKLNYFVRLVAKIYAATDINPPLTSKKTKLCINNDRILSKNKIMIDAKSVIEIISHLCKSINAKDLLGLNCGECCVRKMEIKENTVLNELLTCYCVRIKYCEPKSEDVTIYCRKPDIMHILTKNNKFLFDLYTTSSLQMINP